jgi:hypothetical protein
LRAYAATTKGTNMILDAIEHGRIIADFENVCATAGVQGRFLKESMTEYCQDVEVDWVRRFHAYRAEGCPGLLLEGVAKPDTRCQAIAAALVRNYIDARVIPLNTVMDMSSDGGVPSPSVLVIPNLYTVAAAKNMPAWRVGVVYDLLLNRATQGKPSVVYVENLKSLVGVYGAPFHDFLDNFRRVKDGE